MITCQEADRIIRNHIPPRQKELCPINRLNGEIILRTICTDRDFPPYDRVQMDGIAIRWQDWQNGMRDFTRIGIQKAGEDQKQTCGAQQCIEVTTGSLLPRGTDTVVPYEDMEFLEDKPCFVINTQATVQPHQYIHPQGSEYPANHPVIFPQQVMHSPQVAAVAAVGLQKVLVSRRPSIAIVTSGDEIVGENAEPSPYQIRPSNRYAILAALNGCNYKDYSLFHLQDDPKQIVATLERVLSEFEVLIITGGASKGRFDFFPKMLGDLKADLHFHRVKQRPGKPFWFATGQKQQLLFGLPGNPVAVTMLMYRYVLPALDQHIGRPSARAYARLKNTLHFPPTLNYFCPVRGGFTKKATLEVECQPSKSSGDLLSLISTIGFIDLPAEPCDFHAGEIFPFYSWSNSSLQ